MYKVTASTRHNMARLLDVITTKVRNEGKISSIVNTSGLRAVSLAQEDADSQQSQYSSLRVGKEAVRSLFAEALRTSLAHESEFGETIEGNGEAGVEEGNEALLTDAQLKAGALTAAALDKPVEYAQMATQVNMAGAADSDPLASGAYTADTIVGQAIAQEAYDAPSLQEFAALSMVYNVFAARQSPLQELFYPTITLPAIQNGVEISTRYQVYYNDARHKPNGSIENFNRIPLYQAVNDPSVLFNEITRLYPVYDTAADIAANFAPGFAPVPVTLDGVAFETAPLAVGREIGLIGLSQGAIAGFTGEMDSTDQIANGARVANIYLEVTSKAGKKSIIKFPLRNLGRTAYLPVPEGLDMDMLLNFVNKQLPLTAQTRDVDGNLAEALDFLRATGDDHVLHVGINVTSNLNLETGLVTVNPAFGAVAPYVLRVNANNTTVREADEAKATDLRSGVANITLAGWDPDMNRTNFNLRQRGPLCGTQERRERYVVRLNPPVAAIAPLTETQTTADFIAPVTAVRIRNDNNAITHMFATHEALMSTATSFDNSLPRPDIKALGRWVMNPFADHIRVNMLDLISTTRSKNVATDFKFATGNLLREVIFRGIRKSLYETSLRLQTGVDGAKPLIAIGTNPVLAKHLNVKSTAGWLGEDFPYDVKIESHEDRRLGGLEDNVHELFIGLVLPGTQWSPHQNGHFLYIPELVTTLKTQRNGSNSRELIVMSRCEHIQLCPWLVRVTLTGVSEAFTTRLPYLLTF